MKSAVAIVARIFWRAWPPGKTGLKAKKLDRGIIHEPSAGRPIQNISTNHGRHRALSNCNTSSPFRNATHQFFVKNILRRVTNSQSYQLRRRAADQLCLGNSAPFLALVGVSLASGSGLITKEDELECICREVRSTSRKTQLSQCSQEFSDSHTTVIDVPETKESLSRDDFSFGPVIAKGCNAVVYAGRWVQQSVRSSSGLSTQGKRMETIVEEDSTLTEVSEVKTREFLAEVEPQRPLKSSAAASGEAENDQDYPLAIKMMFNYDIESNAASIFKAMQKEMVVAQTMFLPDETLDLLQNRFRSVPGHPNIVKMVAAFADAVPSLSGSLDLYPAALPARLNPTGYGRNMSLFLVMKRYDTSLRSFLDDHNGQLPFRTSLVLLTQLLEGVSHLVRHGVCHRDLKSDNILLEGTSAEDFPLLAITDFGCCIADKQLGLKIPFTSYEIDRGGNAALMAPEIATAEPGLFTYLDYSKADLWAAATIGYEIFGHGNPFYDDHAKKRRLDSRTYNKSDLPVLKESVPQVMTSLLHSILHRQPRQRISADLAATVCQLLLWAPKSWIDPNSPSQPDTQDILQWILTMTTKVLYESRFSNTENAQREYQLVATFLSRISIRDTKEALKWINQNSV